MPRGFTAPPANPEVRDLRSVIGILARDRPADDPDLVAARRRLAELRIQAAYDAVMASPTPLSINQRKALASYVLTTPQASRKGGAA